MLTFTGWTDLAPREKKQAQIILIRQCLKKYFHIKMYILIKMVFFRNILFDASEYLINFDLNCEFGTNKCLCLFDVLQKRAESS